jgi:hypothetical protein
MGLSTSDWVALFIFGVSALVGTFGKRLLRIIGLVVMPFCSRWFNSKPKPSWECAGPRTDYQQCPEYQH